MPPMVVILVVLGLVAGVLAALAPFGRRRCGGCALYDKARHLCLGRDITVGDETPGCVTYKERKK
jgi:hypothetical protein